MPSADFCLITDTGAVPKEPHVRQTSPDKNMNCHCATAAFTLILEPWTSLSCANSSPEIGLIGNVCSSARRVAGSILHKKMPLWPAAEHGVKFLQARRI